MYQVLTKWTPLGVAFNQIGPKRPLHNGTTSAASAGTCIERRSIEVIFNRALASTKRINLSGPVNAREVTIVLTPLMRTGVPERVGMDPELATLLHIG